MPLQPPVAQEPSGSVTGPGAQLSSGAVQFAWQEHVAVVTAVVGWTCAVNLTKYGGLWVQWSLVWPGVAGRGVLQAGSTGPWPGSPIQAGFLLPCPSPSPVLSKTPVPGLTGFLPCGLLKLQVVEAIKAPDVSSRLQTGFQRGG